MSLNLKKRLNAVLNAGRGLVTVGLLIAVLTSFSQQAHARKNQWHGRTGYVSGSYNGTFKGSFSVNAAFDMDFEMFIANNTSVLFRFIQALDWPETRPFYTYSGLGSRYYFGSKGPFTVQQDPGIYIAAKPKYRFYLGGDLGVAQVVVKTFGAVVQAVANMMDMGVNVGAIVQITDNLGVEAQLGASYGYGISSVQATGTTARALCGISYYF